MDGAETTAGAFYSRIASWYDRLARAPGIGRVRRQFVRAFDPPRNGRVIEFGCGTGANHRYVRRAIGPDGTYVGVDLAPGVLRLARAREASPNTHFVRGDATHPPLRNTVSPDAVCATFLVGMLTDPAAVVRQWARLVGSGGRLALLNLRRTDATLARPANGVFRLAVRLGAPAASTDAESPVAQLDRRVTAAHDALQAVCRPDSHRRDRLFAGFGVLSAGTVAEPNEWTEHPK